MTYSLPFRLHSSPQATNGPFKNSPGNAMASARQPWQAKHPFSASATSPFGGSTPLETIVPANTVSAAPAATSPKKPLLLLIFDGWGIRKNGPGNAIEAAQPQFYQRLLTTYPWVSLEASGEAVGLPSDNPGNSEVGHLTMGTGRILYQDLPKINRAITDDSFKRNPVFLAAVDHAKKTGGTLHLMGLASDGGVHSHINHLLALIDFAKEQNVKDVRIHAFLDGRDTSPQSAEAFLNTLENKLRQTGYPPIATVSGRYYAMDRDKRWDRVETAFDNMTSASGKKYPTSLAALRDSYSKGKNDEFVLPAVTDPFYRGMNNGDSILLTNFRPDRARQITQALSEPDFIGFARKKVLDNLYMGTMTSYDDASRVPAAFTKDKPDNTLAQLLSQKGYQQFHTAETEKYAHVTYFFNGGVEPPYPGEERKLVPSPQVATYDLKPEMSVKEVGDEVVQSLESGKYDFIVANFANPDMVGHTGVEPAAVAAVKSVDTQLKRIVETLLKKDGTMVLTADHGKVETMVDDAGQPFTAHTRNPVPMILVSNNPKLKLKKPVTAGLSPGLSSVAPTILDLFGLAKPQEMTGPSLLDRVG